MLNISNNPIPEDALNKYSTYRNITQQRTARKLVRWLAAFAVLFLIILFLPWTQNIRGKGKITTLRPEHRPQSIYAMIGGKIEQWYVREGDLVEKGDTIAFISEIKADYFDPQLLERTEAQVTAKKQAATSYTGKAGALDDQIVALIEARDYKTAQAKNKIEQSKLKVLSDSADWQAAKIDFDIANYQLRRTDTLYQKGIKSLTDVEEKRRKVQETTAKKIGYENKYWASIAELENAILQYNSIASEYADKIAKSSSDKFSTLSDLYDAQGNIAKLENTYSNYKTRSQYYYIIAPQNCYITKTLKKGLGEIVKENEEIVSIMPANIDLAVEMYIRPMDYPLISKGNTVRLVFDGWPAFVFSGWSGQSFGTFGGTVVGMDNITNEYGLYRILVAPDTTFKQWPQALRVGSAVDGMVLLNDVPIWYEIWRQLNGFPPDYYKSEEFEKLKLKAPAQQLKKD